MPSPRRYRHPIALISLPVLFVFCAAWASAQSTPPRTSGGTGIGAAPGEPGDPSADRSAIVVHVQDALGSPLAIGALVKLTSMINPGGFTTTTMGGVANFTGIRGGDYTITVSAAGYKTAQEDVTVISNYGRSTVFIQLKVDDGSIETVQPRPNGGAPILVGKSRKEFDIAIASLRADKPAEARPHIEYVLKHAPGNPDVQYIAALYALRIDDFAEARKHLEEAAKIYPQHFAAQLALGNMLLQQSDVPGAITHLEQALTIDANSWRAHWLLAVAYQQAHQDPEKTRSHAAKAMELDPTKAAGAALPLARAEVSLGQKDEARATLEKFLATKPTGAEVDSARNMLNWLTPIVPVAEVTPVKDEPSIPLHAPSGANLLIDVPSWSSLKLPGNIDDVVPPVDASAACTLPQVLEGASRRERDFVVALERFSAKENVTHDELDSAGITQRTFQHAFNYIVSLEHPRSDVIIVDEMRDGSFGLADFPAKIANEGVPAMALIFHSNYSSDFDFKCEGLGRWKGKPVWQVRFEQRLDRPARIHEWVINGHEFPASLKGRAWITPGSYRIVHVETDLAKPIPDIKLEYQHMSIDYAPVKYPDGKDEMWLPTTAEIYGRFHGHFYRQVHAYSDFLLFRVDTKQKDKTPAATNPDPEPHL